MAYGTWRGFIVTGNSRCFARARGEEIDLVHLTLR